MLRNRLKLLLDDERSLSSTVAEVRKYGTKRVTSRLCLEENVDSER